MAQPSMVLGARANKVLKVRFPLYEGGFGAGPGACLCQPAFPLEGVPADQLNAYGFSCSETSPRSSPIGKPFARSPANRRRKIAQHSSAICREREPTTFCIAIRSRGLVADLRTRRARTRSSCLRRGFEVVTPAARTSSIASRAAITRASRVPRTSSQGSLRLRSRSRNRLAPVSAGVLAHSTSRNRAR
jgi:hypothetical protein